MKQNKVSVVMPIYNQEMNLDMSFPAILNQSWENTEIIAVNDGSLDSSDDIIRSYASKDSRIVVVEKKNGGLVDATIAGIKAATGEYICFLDPDDFVGPDFIKNFMDSIKECDCAAMGYFENFSGKITPKFLYKDKVYSKAELDKYRSQFLVDEHIKGISTRFFISRWNKLYKTSCIKEIVPELEKSKSISLGEDTIFTYLMLRSCKSCCVKSAPNEYFYMTNSSTSMMKSDGIKAHRKKSFAAYSRLKELLNQDGLPDGQAEALYYFLIQSLENRLEKQNDSCFGEFCSAEDRDKIYRRGAEIVEKNKSGKLFVKKHFGIYSYHKIKSLKEPCRSKASYIKFVVKQPAAICKDAINKDIHKALKLAEFRKKRKTAFTDLDREMPELYKRISKILEPWKGLKSDLNACTLERNVFVFWWDGFENAPSTVKACFQSVVKNHPNERVIAIDKNNYRDYTDINEVLLTDFENGKISIQTFSDILRFNLLKNNGGVWIDATIFFLKEYSLIDKLKDKPVESLVFATTRDFFSFKGENCSWSGYYFASRKNSVFVSAMNDIFEKYYLKYNTFSVYFFIDAALMTCKIDKIDGAALDNIHENLNDMFILSQLLNCRYSATLEFACSQIPQKLAWFAEINKENKNSMYSVLLEPLVK